MHLKDSRLLPALALPLLLLAGCGSGSGGGTNITPPAATFAYAASEVNANIIGYSLNPSTGALTQLPGFPLTTAVNLTTLATDPLGKFVVTNENPGIAVYSINQTTGALTPIPAAAVTLQLGVKSFAFNPSGTLLVASTISGGIDPPGGTSAPHPNPLNVFSLNRSTGALTAVPGSPFAITSSGSNACCLAINSTGTTLYTTDGALLDAYSINPTTGALSLINSVTGPAWPMSLALDPSGAFVYMTDFDTKVIRAYSINPSTSALSIGPVSPTADATASIITLNPTGNIAFTAEAPSTGTLASTDIKTYSIANGKLTNIGSVSAPMSVQALRLGPSGSFLYAAEDNAYLGSVGSTSQVATYSISTTGTLTSTEPVPTVQWPTTFAIASTQ